MGSDGIAQAERLGSYLYECRLNSAQVRTAGEIVEKIARSAYMDGWEQGMNDAEALFERVIKEHCAGTPTEATESPTEAARPGVVSFL